MLFSFMFLAGVFSAVAVYNFTSSDSASAQNIDVTAENPANTASDTLDVITTEIPTNVAPAAPALGPATVKEEVDAGGEE